MKTLTETMRSQIDLLEASMNGLTADARNASVVNQKIHENPSMSNEKPTWPKAKIDKRTKMLNDLGITAGTKIRFRKVSSWSEPFEATVKAIDVNGFLVVDPNETGGEPRLDPLDIGDGLDYITPVGVVPAPVKTRLDKIAKAGLKVGSKLIIPGAGDLPGRSWEVKDINDDGLVTIVDAHGELVLDLAGSKWIPQDTLSQYEIKN